eukprot:757060-Hanusia_phi.AAC.3
MEVIVREFKIKAMPKRYGTTPTTRELFPRSAGDEVSSGFLVQTNTAYRIQQLLQQAKGEAQAEKTTLEKQAAGAAAAVADLEHSLTSCAEYEAGGSIMERLAHEYVNSI